MSNAPTITETVNRVREDLKDKGKSLVSIENEANGSIGIAEAILIGAANAESVKVKTKVNKKSVSGKVVDDS